MGNAFARSLSTDRSLTNYCDRSTSHTNRHPMVQLSTLKSYHSNEPTR